MFTKIDKESFVGMSGDWCDKWKDYLNETSVDKDTGKRHYRHKKLKSAYLSIRRNLPHLFVWYDNIE